MIRPNFALLYGAGKSPEPENPRKGSYRVLVRKFQGITHRPVNKMGRPEAHPYDEWFDGEIRTLNVQSLGLKNSATAADRVYKAARRRGVIVHCQKLGPYQIRIQAETHAT